MSIRVITDSAASLPERTASELGVTVVPLELVVGGEPFHDGELPLESVIAHLSDGVSTASPSPGRFTKAIEDGVQDGDRALLLTISRRMSSTYDAATLAARAVDGPVRVVDTETAAGAQGLVVLHAARCARGTDDLAAVERAAADAIGRVRLVATVDSLDQLVAGGRVPELAGRAGRALGVNPLFEFRRGRVRALRPAFSRQAALERLVGLWRRTIEPGAALHVAALHADDPDGAAWLLDAVQQEAAPATAFVAEFSTVMVAHTGPGLAGLAWWWEPAAGGSG
jgi:DegV family protein with EDD domain